MRFHTSASPSNACMAYEATFHPSSLTLNPFRSTIAKSALLSIGDRYLLHFDPDAAVPLGRGAALCWAEDDEVGCFDHVRFVYKPRGSRFSFTPLLLRCFRPTLSLRCFLPPNFNKDQSRDFVKPNRQAELCPSGRGNSKSSCFRTTRRTIIPALRVSYRLRRKCTLLRKAFQTGMSISIAFY